MTSRFHLTSAFFNAFVDGIEEGLETGTRLGRKEVPQKISNVGHGQGSGISYMLVRITGFQRAMRRASGRGRSSGWNDTAQYDSSVWGAFPESVFNI